MAALRLPTRHLSAAAFPRATVSHTDYHHLLHRTLFSTCRASRYSEAAPSSSHTNNPSGISRFIPRVLSPETWSFLRPLLPNSKTLKPKPKKPWNPYTVFICLFLALGSEGIQTISAKQQNANNVNALNRKIDKLREVVQRLQRGENVDIARELGTGNAKAEEEWGEWLEMVQKEEAWAERRTNNDLRRLQYGIEGQKAEEERELRSRIKWQYGGKGSERRIDIAKAKEEAGQENTEAEGAGAKKRKSNVTFL